MKKTMNVSLINRHTLSHVRSMINVDPVGINIAAGTVDFDLAAGTLSAVTITKRGSGYVTAPTVQVTGGGGSNAVVTATISNLGTLRTLSLDNVGEDYTSQPDDLVFVGGQGLEAGD